MRFVNVFIFILRTILGTQVERRKKPRTCCTRDLPDQLRLSGLTPGNKRLPVKIRHRSMKYFKIQCCSQTSEPHVCYVCYSVSINLCWPWCFLLHSFMFSSDMSHCAVCFYDSCVCECVCESEREFMTSRMMVWQEVWSSQKAAAFRPCCCRQSTSLPFFFRRLRRVVLTPPPPPPPTFFSSLPFFSWFLPFSFFCFPSLSFPLLFFFKDNLSKNQFRLKLTDILGFFYSRKEVNNSEK